MIYSKLLFIIGFLFSIILFVGVNIYSYNLAFPHCCDMPVFFGFPFEFGSYGGFITLTNIYWVGVVKNLLFAIVTSSILGWILDRIFVFRNRMK